MKQSHKDILNKIETYLSEPGAEHLRFWQALYNMNVVKENKRFDEKEEIVLPITIKDDYNISDEALLKRIKTNV